MKKLYLSAIWTAILLFSVVLNAQNLDWTAPAPTGTGNATIAVYPESILYNSQIVKKHF